MQNGKKLKFVPFSCLNVVEQSDGRTGKGEKTAVRLVAGSRCINTVAAAIEFEAAAAAAIFHRQIKRNDAWILEIILAKQIRILGRRLKCVKTLFEKNLRGSILR